MPLCFLLRSCLWNLSLPIPWRFQCRLFPQPEAVDSSVLPAPEIVESPELPLMDPLEDLPLGRSRCHNHRRLLPQSERRLLFGDEHPGNIGASRVESFGCPSWQQRHGCGCSVQRDGAGRAAKAAARTGTVLARGAEEAERIEQPQATSAEPTEAAPANLQDQLDGLRAQVANFSRRLEEPS